MNEVLDHKKEENNEEMIDEKDELLPEMPICVDISINDEQNPPNPDEIILEENPSKDEKESEKNPNLENDKSLTIIKISGIAPNSSVTAPAKKTNKNNSKITQNIRKTKNRRGLKSSKCNICRKSKELISCRKCPKSFHLACMQIKEENLPKMFLCPKCKDKVRLQKKRYRERVLKRKQNQNQNPIETVSTNKDKPINTKNTQKGGDKADKAKNDKKKKFEEFAKKYPKYIIDGRIKFPIDDKLLQLYGSIFNDSTKMILYVNID